LRRRRRAHRRRGKTAAGVVVERLRLSVVIAEIGDGGRGGAARDGGRISIRRLGFSRVHVGFAEGRWILGLLGDLTRPVADITQFFLERRRRFTRESAKTGAAADTRRIPFLSSSASAATGTTFAAAIEDDARHSGHAAAGRTDAAATAAVVAARVGSAVDGSFPRM